MKAYFISQSIDMLSRRINIIIALNRKKKREQQPQSTQNSVKLEIAREESHLSWHLIVSIEPIFNFDAWTLRSDFPSFLGQEPQPLNCSHTDEYFVWIFL